MSETEIAPVPEIPTEEQDEPWAEKGDESDGT